MNLLDKLLALGSFEDLTESDWWANAVFRGLAEDANAADGTSSTDPVPQRTDLT